MVVRGYFMRCRAYTRVALHVAFRASMRYTAAPAIPIQQRSKVRSDRHVNNEVYLDGKYSPRPVRAAMTQRQQESDFLGSGTLHVDSYGTTC